MCVMSDKLTESLGSKRTGDCQELWRSRRTSTEIMCNTVVGMKLGVRMS